MTDKIITTFENIDKLFIKKSEMKIDEFGIHPPEYVLQTICVICNNLSLTASLNENPGMSQIDNARYCSVSCCSKDYSRMYEKKCENNFFKSFFKNLLRIY